MIERLPGKPLLLLAAWFLGGLILLGPCSAWAEEDPLFTLWPLVDYRRAQAVEYRSLHLLGPLFKHERRSDETEAALRPLWFSAGSEAEGLGYTEILFPLIRSSSDPTTSRTRAFGLLDWDTSQDEDGTTLTLFPFFFYRDAPGQDEEDYVALWPLAGSLRHRLWRDRIRFALWPLYVETEKNGTRITNLPWPFFARIHGENEQGVKLWPLFGYAAKEGVYRKQMFLWPIVFHYDLALDTASPEHIRTVAPLYVLRRTPTEESVHWLWPLFRRYDNVTQNYREYDLPWPLVKVGDGDKRKIRRFLPLFADERRPDQRKRWFLWPLYKIEEAETEAYYRRRDRILFFLYSDTRETIPDLNEKRLHRVAFWPLFTYERTGKVRSFRAFSLLEPIFPDREGITRNWSPLWWVYQQRWDADGNRLVSVLWNLYWEEHRGTDQHHELFPLWRYRREGEERDLILLKGLVGWHARDGERSLTLFYLPWRIPLASGGDGV